MNIRGLKRVLRYATQNRCACGYTRQRLIMYNLRKKLIYWKNILYIYFICNILYVTVYRNDRRHWEWSSNQGKQLGIRIFPRSHYRNSQFRTSMFEIPPLPPLHWEHSSVMTVLLPLLLLCHWQSLSTRANNVELSQCPGFSSFRCKVLGGVIQLAKLRAHAFTLAQIQISGPWFTFCGETYALLPAKLAGDSPHIENRVWYQALKNKF